jgi:threonine dehydrogenase-like Zn-dependent dehydrogenase
MLAKAMGACVIGVDLVEERMNMAKKIGADYIFQSDAQLIDRILEITDGQGVEAAVDCSGNPTGRRLCLEAARLWANVVFLGEQGTVTFEPSPLLLHKQLTLHGSWVTSLEGMQRVLKLLDRKKLHPEVIITDRFDLQQAQEAYAKFAAGKTGKVVLKME